MNKRIIGAVFALMLLLFVAPLAFGARASPNFVLPSALKVVDEEAFLGTAAESVRLPMGLERIGDRAFADMARLEEVYIPPSVKSIGRGAFLHSAKLTVYGVPRSYAADWARAQGYRFVVRDIWHTGWGVYRADADQQSAPHTLNGRICRLAESRPPSTARRADEGDTMRPQERAELHPIDYRFP